MRRILSFIVIGISLCIPKLNAQDERLSNINGLSITHDAGAYFNPFPGLQFGLELGINNLGFVEFEYGRLIGIGNGDQDQAKGHRMLLSFKRPIKSDWTILARLHRRVIFKDEVRQYSRYDDLYFEELSLEKKSTLNGISVGFGYEIPLSRKLAFELGASGGLAYLKIEKENLPEDARELEEFRISVFSDVGDYLYPLVSIFAKIKYKIFGAEY